MRKSLTWAAVGTTVVAAALSVAGTANAATAAARPTSLTIRDSASSVSAGTSVTISGTLSSGHTALGKETVWLNTVGPMGVLHPVRDNPTATGTGEVKFVVTPTATTTYELVFRGARGLDPSHSGMEAVKVAKLPTALSISSPTTPITVGTKETFTGTLTSGTKQLGGRVVWLYTVNSKNQVVHPVGRANTSSTGAVSITTTPPAGTDYYALVYGGNWQYKAAVSAVKKVTVNRIATTLTLSSSATAPVAKGTKVTLTGTLTAGTTGLVGRTVQLQVLVNGKWIPAQAGTGTTLAAGKVTFTRAPSVTTSYRLVFFGGAVYARAVSAPVVVTIS